jgi:hydrogenase expression/formation protein HypC
MCLSIPSKVVKIDSDKNSAQVETMGVFREVGLDLMEDDSIQVGDYVLIHVGFIMNKIDEADALDSLRIYQEILNVIEEDEQDGNT